jgi:glycerophosphoryl diester phosphodiesterase
LQGYRVFAWTVDDIAKMQRLVESGTDGIISNRPELFDEAMGTA